MVTLTCRLVEPSDKIENFPDYVRRTKSVCIYTVDRPKIGSKGLVHLTVNSDGIEKSGVFCVDAVGSKSAHLTASEQHLKELGVKAGDKVEVTLREASAEECVLWLKANEDPERKAFGFILQETLSATKQAEAASLQAEGASKQATIAAEQSARAVKHAEVAAQQSKSASEQAKQNLDQALISEESAKADRKRGAFYAFAAFIAGSLLDVGMLEEKLGFLIPVEFILSLAVLALVFFAIGKSLKASKPKK